MASNIPPHIRADLKAKAWRLHARGRTQAEIAAELSAVYQLAAADPLVGVGQSTVSRWLTGQTRRTLAQLDDEAGFQLVSALQDLRRLAAEAEDAWQRSKSSKKEASKVAVGEKNTTRTKIVDRDGNPAFLAECRAAIDQACRLLAVDRRFAPAPVVDQSAAATDLAAALLEAEADDAAQDQPEPTAENPPDGHES